LYTINITAEILHVVPLNFWLAPGLIGTVTPHPALGKT